MHGVHGGKVRDDDPPSSLDDPQQQSPLSQGGVTPLHHDDGFSGDLGKGLEFGPFSSLMKYNSSLTILCQNSFICDL